MLFVLVFASILFMDLKAETREKFGRGVATLRKSGILPAELYGRGVANLHLSLALKEFAKVYKVAGENTIVNVIVGDKKIPVLINDVALDSVSDELIHADLYAVRMDEKLQAKVPLEFVGESPAVKNAGGVLVKAMQEISVEALPDKIPHIIKVDISKLTEVGQSIRLDELGIPVDVRLLVDSHMVVVTIKAKMTEEQEAALQAAGNVEEIKVETEEKKAERDAAKAVEAPAEGAAGAPAAAKSEAKK